MKRISRVIFLSDTHFPFHNKAALKKLMKVIQRVEPTHVIQCGDLLDMYVFSKYTRSLNITPKWEIEKGLMYAKEMWETIQKIAPKAKCFQLLGNHCERLSKRITEKLPELEGMVSPHGLYDFKGVETKKSAREYLEIDGVIYTHGHYSKSIDHAKFFLKPVVHGHLHSASIIFERPGLWAMSAGYLADHRALPMQYTQTKLNKWVLASGLVINGQPRLIYL